MDVKEISALIAAIAALSAAGVNLVAVGRLNYAFKKSEIRFTSYHSQLTTELKQLYINLVNLGNAQNEIFDIEDDSLDTSQIIENIDTWNICYKTFYNHYMLNKIIFTDAIETAIVPLLPKNIRLKPTLENKLKVNFGLVEDQMRQLGANSVYGSHDEEKADVYKEIQKYKQKINYDAYSVDFENIKANLKRIYKDIIEGTHVD